MVSHQSKQRDFILQTARGSLRGIEVVDSKTNRPIYRRYARIRYALPPRGDRRWRKPEALPADWIFSDGNDHTRDYRHLGAICPQLQLSTPLINVPQEEQEMDEDCLFLNIWVPAGGEGPRGGWPVQFDIKGGLQHSLPRSMYEPINVFREDKASPRVIVAASYRTGVFGFFASEHLLEDTKDTDVDLNVAAGNFGLWDIRMALEWTAANIHLFGGNPRNICAGGYGFLAAHQLRFDAFQQDPAKRLIQRAYLLSGAVCVQPVVPQSTRLRAQFAELCRKLNIDSYTLPAEDCIRLLRGVSTEKLLNIAGTLEDGFKPVTDGHNGFVPTSFMQSIWSGELGKRLKEQGVQVLIGDCTGERSIYEHCFALQNSGRRHRLAAAMSRRQDLVNTLNSFFPEEVVTALVGRYEQRAADWNTIYREIMVDMQCHVAVRGFAQSLFRGGMTAEDVLRYNVHWRPKVMDEVLSDSVAMNHALEPLIWWYSGWPSFTPRDKQDVRDFVRPLARFIQGDISKAVSWGTTKESEVRRLDPDGCVVVAEDQDWHRAIEIWDVIRDAQLQRLRPREGTKCQSIGSRS